MRVNLRSNAGVQFRVLSDDQCEQVKLAAFEVLEDVGARFYEPEALDILEKAGCLICDGNVVRFPSGLITQALGTVPARFTVYTRTGGPAIKVEPNRTYFGPGLRLQPRRNVTASIPPAVPIRSQARNSPQGRRRFALPSGGTRCPFLNSRRNFSNSCFANGRMVRSLRSASAPVADVAMAGIVLVTALGEAQANSRQAMRLGVG